MARSAQKSVKMNLIQGSAEQIEARVTQPESVAHRCNGIKGVSLPVLTTYQI